MKTGYMQIKIIFKTKIQLLFYTIVFFALPITILIKLKIVFMFERELIVIECKLMCRKKTCKSDRFSFIIVLSRACFNETEFILGICRMIAA